MRGGEGRKEGGIGLLPPLSSFSLFLPLSSTQREGKSYVRASEGGGRTISQIIICVSFYSFSPLLFIQPRRKQRRLEKSGLCRS